MAITVTNIFQGTDSSINDVIASADADAAAVVPHGLGAAPAEISFRPLLLAYYTKQWATGVVDATNINCVMGVAVGGGNAAAQVRITARRPHTIGR